MTSTIVATASAGTPTRLGVPFANNAFQSPLAARPGITAETVSALKLDSLSASKPTAACKFPLPVRTTTTPAVAASAGPAKAGAPFSSSAWTFPPVALAMIAAVAAPAFCPALPGARPPTDVRPFPRTAPTTTTAVETVSAQRPTSPGAPRKRHALTSRTAARLTTPAETA